METEELAGQWIMFNKSCGFNDSVRIKRLQIIWNLLRIAELRDALQQGFDPLHSAVVLRLIGRRSRDFWSPFPLNGNEDLAPPDYPEPVALQKSLVLFTVPSCCA